MRIAICGSLAHTYEFPKLKATFELMGFEVEIPFTSREILAGRTTLGKVKSMASSESSAYKSSHDVIRRYHDLIQTCDAILVANYEKKGIAGYIGGNTFLEMGFAHILRKPIFLLNPIPDVSYRDEILAMKPIILNGDVETMQKEIVVTSV